MRAQTTALHARAMAFARCSLSLLLICSIGSKVQAETVGVNAHLSWVVGEKELTLSSNVSEPVRVAMAAVGGPNVQAKKTEFPTTRDAWQATADAHSAANQVTLAFLNQKFGVRVQRKKIAGVGVHDISPVEPTIEGESYVFIHLHGGGYLFGGGAMGAAEGAAIAAVTGLRVISVDYSLLPQSPFPAALNDVVAVYRALAEQFGPANIAMGGSSAGGHLALSTCHKLKALDLELPKVLFLGTPLADLTHSGDTVVTNEGIDNVIGTFQGFHGKLQALFANGQDLNDPLISPLLGDFTGFPATYLVSGTRDILLSDTVRVHLKLRRANIPADLIVFEGLPHGAYAAVPNSPEFDMAYGGLNTFLQQHLRKP